MKRLVSICLFVFGFTLVSFGQQDKVVWSSEAKKIDDNTYNIVLTADVDSGWYIYSQFIEPGGPIPTAIELKGGNFEVQGKVSESGEVTKEIYDDVFEIDVKKFGSKAIFTQKVKTMPGQVPTGKALVTFMSCNDLRCNPPQQVEVQF